MIIDVHTHIFPDKIAGKVIPNLASIIKLAPSMDGTIGGLRVSMENAGVDLSIILPVVTAPEQFDSIIRFASYINENYSEVPGPKLLSFAGIHPDCDHYKEKMQLIAREGFKGIKLHPNYQGKHFDDIGYMRIVYAASELGLSVLTHTGFDPFTPDEVYCSPEMILRVIEETAPPRLILAHLGSNEGYDEVLTKLCGKNVYLDTAYSLMHMPEETFLRIVRAHGADKILFGTDAPWTSQKESVEKLHSLTGLTEAEKQMILCENTSRLLKL